MTSTFCSRSDTESSQEVMFSPALVCLFVSKQDYAETTCTSPIFTKFSGKAAHGPMKKRLILMVIQIWNGSVSRNFLNDFFFTAVLAMVKAHHSVGLTLIYDSSVKIHRLADLRLNEL